MDTLPIYLLESFCVVAQSPSLIAAAGRLQVTQPTLSRQMQQLEEALPYPLFEMSGRKKVLTQFGEALLATLRGPFENIHHAVKQTQIRFSSPAHAHIKMGGRLEILQAVMSELDFPGTLELVPLGGEEVVQNLLHRKLDLAISQRRPNSAQIIAKLFFKRQ